MEKHNFIVTISIDGNKYQHDLYRKNISGKGSYDKIISNLKFFKRVYKISARITVSNHNPDIFRAIESILSLGIRRITFDIDYSISSINFKIFENSFRKVVEKYRNDIKNGFFYDITNISSIIALIALKKRKISNCNAGLSYLTFSADGKIYRCPRFIGNKKFCIGSIEEKVEKNIENEKNNIKEILNSRKKICNKCVYHNLCGGTCYHHASTKGKSMLDIVTDECYLKKLVFSEAINLICTLSDKERRKFILFLSDLWKECGKGESV